MNRAPGSRAGTGGVPLCTTCPGLWPQQPGPPHKASLPFRPVPDQDSDFVLQHMAQAPYSWMLGPEPGALVLEDSD